MSPGSLWKHIVFLESHEFNTLGHLRDVHAIDGPSRSSQSGVSINIHKRNCCSFPILRTSYFSSPFTNNSSLLLMKLLLCHWDRVCSGFKAFWLFRDCCWTLHKITILFAIKRRPLERPKDFKRSHDRKKWIFLTNKLNIQY